MLNPTLYSRVPTPIANEHFLLTREGISCDITVPQLPVLRGTGLIYLTTLRIVFVNNKRVTLGGGQFFEAFELPLTTLFEEKFNQPIFGANNLTGSVKPVANSGLGDDPVKFKLTFKDGGCGTFLHFFLRVLREIRGGGTRLGAAAASGTLRTEAAAYLDPSDPTVIYVIQPPTVSAEAVPIPVATPIATSSDAQSGNRM